MFLFLWLQIASAPKREKGILVIYKKLPSVYTSAFLSIFPWTAKLENNLKLVTRGIDVYIDHTPQRARTLVRGGPQSA